MPLPKGTQLPDGAMELLVMTTIITEEMRWSISMREGRATLLERLCDTGSGQISILGRLSEHPH